MSKRFLLTLVIIILGFGGIFWLTRDKAGAPDGGDTTGGQVTNHTYGTGTAVTLIEYGDFQCPACAAYHPIVTELKEKYKDQMTFQFRHFPLMSIHPNALAASRAAEAAGKQNKFWEMHDLLYQQQPSWKDTTSAQTVFEQYATSLGLNIEQFRTDYASSETNSSINADIREIKALGGDSTPSFVLNGKLIKKNPADKAAFETLIKEAIDSNKQ